MFAFRRSHNTLHFHEKRRGPGGKSCKHIYRHKESTLTDYHSFQDLSGKFPHSKAIDFLIFSLYKYRKSLTIKTTLMSLNWEIMDQTMQKIYTNTHTSQFFQPMHLNSIFLQQKVRLKWTYFLSDKQKIKATVELLFYSKHKMFC